MALKRSTRIGVSTRMTLISQSLDSPKETDSIDYLPTKNEFETGKLKKNLKVVYLKPT